MSGKTAAKRTRNSALKRHGITLRPARETDMELVNAYAAWEGMDAIPSPEGVTVAVNKDDAPVGFVRVWVDEREGQAYVNPIVLYRPWRRLGIGQLMMEDVQNRFGSIRLVSRGVSVPFYRALGYVDIEWERIAPEIASDCDGCEMRDECKPQPMEHA